MTLKERRQLEQLLASITYKPGWTIRGDWRFDQESQPLMIRISFWTADADYPSNQVEIAATHYYSVDDYNPEYFVQFVSDCIKAMEDHERNEWFRVGGVQRVPTHQ